MRTEYCGLINRLDEGQHVVLCGWVDARRDHGGVVFLDLRDHEGIAQVVAPPDDSDVFAIASQVGYEYCLRVEGVVRQRSNVNKNIPTGQVEVLAARIDVLNATVGLPFALHESPSEETRLRYRYLDLRRTQMQDNLRLRARLTSAVRRWLEDHGFQDIETPMLGRATPEGARDYLVPSRVHPGEFYALPQSPQLFKQLLMVAGFDRYYQIARCFRDEDLRADRQPEFTQLDIELAFVDEATIQNAIEAMITTVFREVIDVDLQAPFARMTWHEAMRRFGSDKPDLRIAMELVDIGDAVRDVGFKVFSEPANAADGRVAALRVPTGATLSRRQIDGLAAHAVKHGAKGLAWLRVEDPSQGHDGVTSPIAKFLDAAALRAVLDVTEAQAGDLLLFGAGDWQDVSRYMGAVRLQVAAELNLVEEGWQPLWVTDFPMFEWDDEAQRLVALHHPFTAPQTDDIDQLRADPRAALSRGYDLVLNGAEIGGGSIRIHDAAMQQAILGLLGIDADEAQAKFGFLLDALKCGAPPHGGIAFGVDRIAALMAGSDSIRDVIAFPKTTGAQCLMTRAPSAVDAGQLAQLGIGIVAPGGD